MTSLEEQFGRMVRMLVAHMIKNSEPVAPILSQAAILCEKRQWAAQAPELKLQKVREIAAATGQGTHLWKHFVEYPHAYSRRQFESFQTALAGYLRELMG